MKKQYKYFYLYLYLMLGLASAKADKWVSKSPLIVIIMHRFHFDPNLFYL